jgi:hypothetical protein
VGFYASLHCRHSGFLSQALSISFSKSFQPPHLPCACGPLRPAACGIDRIESNLMATAETLPKGITLLDHKMKRSSSRTGVVVFLLALAVSLCYIVFHVARDLDAASVTSYGPYLLLGLALLIALGFEFVNGFHDTANAVATVIYTHSLEPNIAVVWSGLCNLAGVLFSTGTVAFAVITLLPVELILQVSSGAGFAMVFALLIAAILWNLGTWWFGLPASSSHTLVGSIIGVGLANQLLNPHTSAYRSQRHSRARCARRGYGLHTHQEVAAGYGAGDTRVGRGFGSRSGPLQGIQSCSTAGSGQCTQRHVCGK